MWRRLLVVLVNLIIFAVLAEAAGVLVHYAETGRLFYTNTDRRRYPPIEETRRGELTADALHPYFGPMHRPGVRPESNNVGFGSPRSFPFHRTDDRQFLVGVFGGSVARYFCDRGMPRLAEVLRRDSRFAQRDIVPLCFSHEGYKQPQQLLVMAYFLSIGQELDLAINIDGFNEVALGTYNQERGRDISMPSPIHLDPLIALIDRSTMTPAMIASLAAIEDAKRRLNDVGARAGSNRSAAVNLVLDRYYAFTLGRYESERARFATLPANPPASSLLLVTPAVRPRDGARLYDDIAAGWASASLLMHDILSARGVPYVHVLQPNQYFTSRRFGADEARIALNSATPFKAAVEKGYPALVRTGSTLTLKEHFVDATEVFDREPGPVYEDDCCHYTQLGNERLADVIAARVLASPQRSSKDPAQIDPAARR
jgi:hypothetical protein